ncbi:MAG: NAD(P)-binding domain-containing protein, partial [Actinobacteria bacterium]|nr:NAD(P)-binding domain-containing protein [Actinomycetota bacterium]
MRLAVIGAGSWGTTVASLGARNAANVALWARRPELAEALNASGENPDYVQGLVLGPVVATARLDVALDGADVVALAVPSHGFRSVLTAAAPFVPSEAMLLSLAKGLEQGSLKRMTE